ncbi:ectoine/hydroxyectoine ABC transporter ATP-binding protein EhuA [Kyrpidia spormannii]|uniref:Ectoine/hydroxyectoine ABC transporter ATP-binding protein EhuA n=1 Tax=Kyrpidia spormannii TaxID=2055160 RepID=A0A2K8N8S5_9BACL|nr:amino acid ABC transporter ATP-binding protein [Kyrpidia spormannii]ATY85693.1 ectoine/hydroxyectoine ABC transporter ATP-binding protein EhuA [Kyrpidia spormannii]
MSRQRVLEIRGLTKRFGDHTILKDIDLDVEVGEVVAIIGPSGAGKSTLLRCVNYLQPFESGTIRVLGHMLKGSDSGWSPSHRELTEIRKKVGMVFQRFNLFPHLTVLENIILAPMDVNKVSKQEAIQEARRLLDLVGLGDKENAYPRNLSGGQQQRVAICRALAMHPQMMLFDEPTSALDPELVGDVLSVIRQLAADGMTMLLVTHEMAFARDVADTIVVMADQQIIESGPARKLLSNPEHERTRTFLRRVLDHSPADDAEPALVNSYQLSPQR